MKQKLLMLILVLLEDWSGPMIVSLFCLLLAASFGCQVYVALSHNIGWNGVVTMRNRGGNSVNYYYVSTLFIYSVVSFLGVPTSFLAGWVHNRRTKMKQEL